MLVVIGKENMFPSLDRFGQNVTQQGEEEENISYHSRSQTTREWEQLATKQTSVNLIKKKLWGKAAAARSRVTLYDD